MLAEGEERGIRTTTKLKAASSMRKLLEWFESRAFLGRNGSWKAVIEKSLKTSFVKKIDLGDRTVADIRILT